MKLNMKNQEGFSLLGIMVGVAIMGMMAASFLPETLMVQLDKVRAVEVSNLAAIQTNLTAYIHAKKIVPSSATWANSVSLYSGKTIPSITTNNMNGQRIFLYPDNFIATGNTLPYDQNANAKAGTLLNAKPVNPRIMIISNLGETTLTQASGVLTATAFNDIWTQAAGTPAELLEGDDLKIQRVNLENSFNNVLLNNQDPANIARFTVGTAPAASIPTNSTASLYLIKNTKLTLNDTAGVAVSNELITSAAAYSFNNTWGSTMSAIAGNTVIGTGFDQGQNGRFVNWSPNSGCSPTGTQYVLTVDASNANGNYYVYAGIAGGATDMGKANKVNPGSFHIGECEIVFVVPNGGQGSTQIHMFYMPHNNLTIVVN